MKESQIQRACLDLLEALRRKGWPIVGTRSNAGKVATIQGYYVALCDEGWPDITTCINGKFVGIETKALKGRQRNSQKRMQEKIEAAGGVYLIVRTLKDLREHLGVGNELGDNTTVSRSGALDYPHAAGRQEANCQKVETVSREAPGNKGFEKVVWERDE